jgi:pyruvate formate lyase activating enzyme
MDLGLKYVYIANVPGVEGNSTCCPKCKKAVVVRLGFLVKENSLDKGVCRFCGAKLPGLW